MTSRSTTSACRPRQSRSTARVEVAVMGVSGASAAHRCAVSDGWCGARGAAGRPGGGRRCRAATGTTRGASSTSCSSPRPRAHSARCSYAKSRSPRSSAQILRPGRRPCRRCCEVRRRDGLRDAACACVGTLAMASSRNSPSAVDTARRDRAPSRGGSEPTEDPAVAGTIPGPKPVGVSPAGQEPYTTSTDAASRRRLRDGTGRRGRHRQEGRPAPLRAGVA